MSNSITTPPLRQAFPPNKIGYQLKNDPKFTETLRANVEKRFINPYNETITNSSLPPLPDANFNYADYLAERGIPLTSAKGRYIARYAQTKESSDAALERYEKQIHYQEVLERSGFLNLVGSDPLFWGEVATGTKLLSMAGKEVTKKIVADSIENGLELGVQRSLLEKNLAGTIAPTAFFEGVGNLFDATTRLNMNEDASTVLKQEAFDYAIAVASATAVGYGFGKYNQAQFEKQELVKRRYDIARNNAKEFMGGINSKPDNPWTKSKDREIVSYGPDVVPPPKFADEDVAYMGEWFTNTIFYKALPTPMKTWIMSNAPAATKTRFLRLANDNGVGFKFNQLGDGVGESVAAEAGRLQGKWAGVWTDIHDLWSQATTRGGASVLDVQVQNTLEKIRKMRGKESLTIDDFGDTLVAHYMNQTPLSELTALERKGVEILSTHFKEWEKLLNEVGLLGKHDSIINQIANATDQLSSSKSIMGDILKGNRSFLIKESENIKKRIATKTTKLEQLNKTFETRGLTAKQADFRARLIDELPELKNALRSVNNSISNRYTLRSMKDLTKVLDDLRLTPKQKKALGNLSKHRDKMQERINNLRAYLDGQADLGEPFFPRYFNHREIINRRDEFTEIIRKEYAENPFVFSYNTKSQKFEKVDLPNDYASTLKRAQQTVNKILDETDEDGMVGAYFGAGKSKHFMHRELDIPNSKLKDFMVTNLKDILVAYNSKVAPKYAFAKQFRNADGNPASLDEVIAQNTKEMTEAGLSTKEINRLNKDFIGTYDRIVGRVMTKPDSLNTRAADWLRTATQWTYLGGAGQAAIADFSNLFLDHEMRTIAKGVTASIEEGVLKSAAKELKRAGDGLEMIQGQFHLKYMENISSDPFRNALTDKINHGFYTFNLLGPATLAAKNMDALFRGHTIIDIATKKANNKKLSNWESVFLSRYNINDDMAKRIAASPVDKTKNQLYLPNTDAWTDTGAVEAFRSALRSGVSNRIIMGTPADKPLAMSGKSYIPMDVAKMIGMKESPRVKGYAELESPLLALPFTFYTYTVGALNKVTTNYAQGLVRNKAAHFIMAMFLGYHIVKARTPSWAWNEMDIEDRALRAFDFSGLAAFYSDMFYRSLEMGMAFDIANPTPFEPKFKQDPDAVGGISSIFGAPADYAYDNVRMIQMFARGEYEEGMEQGVMNIPLLGNMFIKDLRNDLKNVMGDFGASLE